MIQKERHPFQILGQKKKKKKKKKNPKIHDDCTSNFHLGEEAGRQTTTTTITVL
jgi:hypothetical protein